MKKHPLGTVLILGVLFCASTAFAGQSGQPAADNPGSAEAGGFAGCRELTPEQHATAEGIFDMHGGRLHRLREGIWAETAELRALAAAHRIDKSGIEERIARIGALREQLRQELRAVRAELAADGISDFPSHRRGPCPGRVRSVSREG